MATSREYVGVRAKLKRMLEKHKAVAQAVHADIHFELSDPGLPE